MPAFSFEKISPPVSHAPAAPVEKKQRGVIIQILGRFVETRVERSQRVEQSIIDRREQRKPNQD
jgi:hypothetical protein